MNIQRIYGQDSESETEKSTVVFHFNSIPHPFFFFPLSFCLCFVVVVVYVCMHAGVVFVLFFSLFKPDFLKKQDFHVHSMDVSEYSS